MLQKEILFLSGVRTPFGTFGGSLKNLSATELGVIATQGALRKANVAAEQIEQVLFGNVIQTSKDAIYLSRHIGLRAGCPVDAPALTVNRLCGSGFESIIQAARLILLDEAEVVIAGGTESMSQAPHVIRGARWGLRLGSGELEDVLWEGLTDAYCGLPMAQTAENLAEKYNISRAAVDEYALRSQELAAKAQKSGRLAKEIVPVEIKGRRGDTTRFEHDEHLKPETTLEGLSKLKPYFKADGTITAGNASGIVDGAAAMVMCSRQFAEAHSLKPIARLVNWGVAGVEPSIMGIGPAPASRTALKRAGMSIDDMDLVEVNEAFSPQYLAVEKELGLKREITNINGGAIAIGHPLGATGTRLTITLMHSLLHAGLKRGLASACIGGGQGATVIIESLQ
ncbi:MAG: acetyl-CoA C-acetyltransferase [Deferribacteres bacterium]|nr:acetyl-CoA C-acetyltransferase [candidate division KSB1 bacterium]MCB9501274.1 acetyl-CoA C-acetyltransferase [Deferribacteres bacterium]